MRLFLSLCVAFLWSAHAHAQYSASHLYTYAPVNGSSTPTFQSPNPVEGIPVVVTLPGPQYGDGHFLTVTAYAPPNLNARNARPRVIGQTRILLRGTGERIELKISVPREVTSTLNSARISGVIEDEYGKQILTPRDDAYYYAQGPAELHMIAPFGTPLAANDPAAGYELLIGDVNVAGPELYAFQGAMLNVRLIERDPHLVSGGRVLAEEKININGKRAPFRFELRRSLATRTGSAPLQVVADITDWSGRVTHIPTAPIAYSGPNILYRPVLRHVNAPAMAAAHYPSSGHTGYNTYRQTGGVTGQARFDADRGLPAGSRMIVTLKRGYGPVAEQDILERKSISLNGKRGHITFDLETRPDIYNQGHFPATLNVMITDHQGRVFFRSADTPVHAGFNTLWLNATPQY